MIRSRVRLACRGRAARTPPGTRRALQARLGRALVAAGLRGVELSVVLSDDDELRALNRAYAGDDHATDVLSFAQRDAPAPVVGKEALGDVIISVEHAARQAAAAHRHVSAELFHLAVHGLAHLLGYDHRDAVEERAMFGYEARLRSAALADGPPRRVSAPRTGRARSSPAAPGARPRPASRGTGARPRPSRRRPRSRR